MFRIPNNRRFTCSGVWTTKPGQARLNMLGSKATGPKDLPICFPNSSLEQLPGLRPGSSCQTPGHPWRHATRDVRETSVGGCDTRLWPRGLRVERRLVVQYACRGKWSSKASSFIYMIVEYKWFLLANIAPSSKALVTRSDALEISMASTRLSARAFYHHLRKTRERTRWKTSHRPTGFETLSSTHNTPASSHNTRSFTNACAQCTVCPLGTPASGSRSENPRPRTAVQHRRTPKKRKIIEYLMFKRHLKWHPRTQAPEGTKKTTGNVAFSWLFHVTKGLCSGSVPNTPKNQNTASRTQRPTVSTTNSNDPSSGTGKKCTRSF